jgi:predicted amidohydrolase YtcJ
MALGWITEMTGGVTLAIVNGRVWTAGGATGADAVAVAGDRIVAVGTREQIRALGRPAQEIDARGGLIAPGFIDCHVHLLAGGFRLMQVQLRDVASRDDLTRRLRAFAATTPDGEWITGGDWDHERWGGEPPRREWIDDATPRHPVWINRLDGHMALANSLALGQAGITRASPEVDGGTIVRDAAGEPTGLLKDLAMDLVQRVVPLPSEATADRALDLAMRHVASHGVTSVHHMGSIPRTLSWQEIDVFRRAHAAGRLRTRIYASVPLDSWAALRDLIASRALGGADGRGDEWLRLGALKGFVDGSLGSRTAAFDAPYDDAPDTRGLLVTPPDDLRAWIRSADAAGLHPVVHAIGDRANALLLDIYEQVARERGPRDRRWRIEHAQHLRPQDVARLSRLGVIASMQPSHLADDGRWAERAIGAARAKTTYAVRSLLDAGARVVFGSDWFVAPPVPVEGLAAAVTRQTADGRHPHGWIPGERITIDAAMRAYTSEAAFASFEEGVKGRLAPGLLADVVVLEPDPFAVGPEEIAACRVACTVAGGETIFDRDRPQAPGPWPR